MTRQEQQALVQQYLAALKAGTDFRDRKVRRLRAAIRAGAFENQLKLEVASDRLASDLIDGEAENVPTPR
jgi:anti-sigma28 factor (negative regulator of flagellin synthesis)